MSEPPESGPGGESRRTVVVALLANIGVALAKLAGGLLTGSASLISEAAHSGADVLNELFLLASLHRSSRPADRTHPFGYGKERFFWSLLAAVGIFVTGGLFSVYTGAHAIIHGEKSDESALGWIVAYGVLGFSLVLEGFSLFRALRQVSAEARLAGRRFLTYVIRSPDPTTKTVASEDTVAVIGVLLATVGTVLHQVTGKAAFDGSASIAIGLLLGYVAFALGRDTKDLLIGEAADPAVRLEAFRTIRAHPAVAGVKEILTMQLGPDAVLVAARVDFEDSLSGADIERAADAIERALEQQMPVVKQVFLDPTDVSHAQAGDAAALIESLEHEVRALDGDDEVQRLRDLTAP